MLSLRGATSLVVFQWVVSLPAPGAWSNNTVQRWIDSVDSSSLTELTLIQEPAMGINAYL